MNGSHASSRRSTRSHRRSNQQQLPAIAFDGSNDDCGKAPFDMTASTLLKFYYADDQLNVITAELDSFDGRKDPVRCTNLVNQLR